MNTKTVYSRKISTQEAREGYVMVLKNRLSLFPHLGKSFDLKSGSSVHKVSVQSYHCSCQGPDLPHEHYYIRCEGLRKGLKVTIEKGKQEGEYSIRM